WARPRPVTSDGLMLDHSVAGELEADMWPTRPVSIRGRLWRPVPVVGLVSPLGNVGESIGCVSSSLSLRPSLLLSLLPLSETSRERSGWSGLPSWYSPSTKISGTVNVGTPLMRADFFESTFRRNSRDQYSVSKNPTTVLRCTASSTRCNRARRRRNSSSRKLLLSL